MQRTATVFVVCVLSSLATCRLASAGLIAADGFIVGSGGYTAGNLSGQGPAAVGFAGAWSGNTATISVVSTGLEYPGLDVAGGTARFNYGSNLGDYPRYLTRALSAYDDAQDVYYFSGLMSFDGSFSTSSDSYGLMGFVNGTGNDTLFGLQWGFHGDGEDGVDAFVRVRDFAGGTEMSNHVLADNIEEGPHLFVMKLEPNTSGTNDTLSIWFDPVAISSEGTAGTPTWHQDTMVWVPGDTNYLVDMLLLKTYSAGAGATVGFDEARMGATWASVTPEPGTSLLLLIAVVCGLSMRRK